MVMGRDPMVGNGARKAEAAYPIMTSKLYVGNLPFATTAQELQDMFSQHGDVSAVDLIYDKFTGRSRGFAFVSMASPEDAKKAMEHFNGFGVGGRNLTVNEARPQEPRSRAFAGGGEKRHHGNGGREERGGGHREHRGERNYRG
jgi:RNA recognition motif-containing protein